MPTHEREEGSRFIVDLGAVALPPLVEKQVETEIRGVVLRALAENNFRAHPRLSRSIFDNFPGRTLGLWLDPDRHIPWPTGPLEPWDHTLIMRSLMTHPIHVVRALGVSKGDPTPSGRQVLEAMLDIDEIDAFTKERIGLVLKILEQIEPAMAKPSREQRLAVTCVEKLIGGRPLLEQIQILRDTVRSPDGLDGHVPPGLLEWIIRMLEDGASTIYSADFGFHRMLSSGRSVAKENDPVKGIVEADELGAAGGGCAGTWVFPGVGTAGGAATFATAASAGFAIGEFLGWLFG